MLAGLLTGLIAAGSLGPFVAPAYAAGTVTPATGGVTDTASAASITLQLNPNPADSGAALTCTSSLTRTAVTGVATFSGCKIDKPGTGDTITAFATGPRPRCP